ncbi:MAG TPA: type IV pilus secretin PilQ, partial [Nitrospirota bacterium]|nr:type IV pilus secretin PilQ [Nitrospirota bacterium]
EVQDVLRAVGQAAGMNLIVGENVTGKVSLSLNNVDIWEALDSILRTKGLTYVRDGNITRVISVAEAREEDMETRVFSLDHANGREIVTVVEKVKSDRAKVSADSRMNAIVVKDLAYNIDRMERLLRDLDVRAAQVLIEARIVEVASNYTQELGIQWGGKYTGSSSRGYTVTGGATGITSTGAVGASTPAIGSTVFYPQTGDIGRSGNAFAVNLPASVGQGTGGVLGVTYGTLMGKAQLDLQLSAMQSTGNGRLLSSPKVLTLNNKEAKISSGIDIPVRVLTTTTAGTTAEVKTISANLALSTTPTVMSGDKVSMAIKVEKAEPDFSQEVDGIPTITRRSANAELIMDSGETVVLGGILIRSESQVEDGIPLLSKIPILGWLFKKRTTVERENELLIFITPTIVKE